MQDCGLPLVPGVAFTLGGRGASGPLVLCALGSGTALIYDEFIHPVKVIGIRHMAPVLNTGPLEGI